MRNVKPSAVDARVLPPMRPAGAAPDPQQESRPQESHAPQRRFAWRLAAAPLALALLAWLFGAIAEDVINHDAPLGAVDFGVSHWLHVHGTPGWTALMLALTNCGAPIAVAAIAAVVALFLLWHRRHLDLLLLTLAVPGGGLLNLAIKQLVHRQRPLFDDPILTLASYSFPSGHAMGSTVLYGVLAVLLVREVRTAPARAAATAVAVLVIAAICFSRVYLGVHFLSDVIAGALEGAVWLGSCVFAVDALRRRGERRRQRA